jgi:HlyD family secretion protein
MKKITYYLVIIGYWVYSKYVKDDPAVHLTFAVQRGDINELVRVRGEVVSGKELNLEFPFSGTLKEVLAKEGSEVAEGGGLLKLDTVDFELEERRLRAVLSQQETSLEKILAGAADQDIKVLETQVANAERALTNTEQKAVSDLQALYDAANNVIQDASVKSEDAVYKYADEMMTDPNSSNAHLSFTTLDPQIKIDVDSKRVSAAGSLAILRSYIVSAIPTTHDGLDEALTDTHKHVLAIKTLLDRMNDALNSASGVSSTTLATYKTNISTARTSVTTALSSVDTHERSIAAQKVYNKNVIDAARSALDLARDNLAAKQAGPRSEDIDIAKAQIREMQAQLSMIQEKIKKSVLRAPVAGKVAKIYIEIGEVFKPGTAAVSLFALGKKIQADISELEIGKIKSANGNSVDIKFDAFPGELFKGKIAVVESKEIIKDGDKYYRINVTFDGDAPDKIRSGMSADLVIYSSAKINVLKIPGIAVQKKNDASVVVVLDGKTEREVEVVTGISDGEEIEVISGLTEGQTVIVRTE